MVTKGVRLFRLSCNMVQIWHWPKTGSLSSRHKKCFAGWATHISICAVQSLYLSRVEISALSTIDTPIHHLFRGNPRNEFYCGACEQTRPNYETSGEFILNINDMLSMDKVISQNIQHRSLPEQWHHHRDNWQRPLSIQFYQSKWMGNMDLQYASQ